MVPSEIISLNRYMEDFKRKTNKTELNVHERNGIIVTLMVMGLRYLQILSPD